MAHLSPLSPSDFPLTFECTSGELIFGQTQCIFEGLQDPTHLKRALPEELQIPSTVLQHKIHYRLAARPGTWKISRIYYSKEILSDENLDGEDQYEEEKVIIGYVVHHQDVSAAEYLKRAATVGTNYTSVVDDGIVYVNRYDWSWQHGSRAIINAALYPQRPWKPHQVGTLMGGRLIVMDASGGDQFKQMVSKSYFQRKSYVLSNTDVEGPEKGVFGVHLTSSHDTEFELGWIGFSGQKHPKFPDSDEVVAVIYDGNYCGLSLSSDTDKLYAEEEVAVVGDCEPAYHGANIRPPGSDDEDYVTEPPEDSSDEDDDDDDDDEDEEAIDEGELASLALPDKFPPPTVVSVEPIWGLGIAIRGTTLRPTAIVEINDTPVEFEVIANDCLHTRGIPGFAGTVRIRVHNPAGSSDVITYEQPPVSAITSIAPARCSKWGGTRVSITGYFLNKVDKVHFDRAPALDLEHISDTQVDVTTPPWHEWNLSVRVHLDEEKGQFDPFYELCTGNPSIVSFQYDPESVPEDRFQTAITSLKRVLDRNPRLIEIRKRLSEAYVKRGDREARVKLWEDANALYTKPDGELLHHLAAALSANEEYVKAIETWDKALQAGCDSKELFDGLGEAYSKNGQYERSDQLKFESERLWEDIFDL